MHCVFIYGAPGSGKLTVARALSERTGLPIHHNHYGVDAALSLFPFGSVEFCALRERLWVAAFEAAAQARQSFIFTFAPDRTVRPGLIEHLADSIAGAGGAVMFVELTCAESELERRIPGTDRARFGKLCSTEAYRALRAEGAFACGPMPDPLIRIPTDELSPAVAAAKIEEALRDFPARHR